MNDALHAEWTKLQTVRGPRWALAATVVLTIGLSVVATCATSYRSSGSDADLTKLSLTGILVGQGAVAVLAILLIGAEYDQGMIRITLTAVPRRCTVLAAKAVILTGTVLVAGTVATAVSIVSGSMILQHNGFTHAHGYPTVTLTNGATLRAAVGSVLYLVLITLLSLAIGTVLRDSAISAGTVLSLLYLVPVLTELVTDPAWQRHLQQIGPTTAGQAIQATSTQGLPISPWAGLGVLAAWAAAGLLGGALTLHRRDAS